MSRPQSFIVSPSKDFLMGKLIRSSEDSFITSNRFCMSGPVVIGKSSAISNTFYLPSYWGMVAMSVLLKFVLDTMCSGLRNSSGGGLSFISIGLISSCIIFLSNVFSCSSLSSVDSSEDSAFSWESEEWYDLLFSGSYSFCLAVENLSDSDVWSLL